MTVTLPPESPSDEDFIRRLILEIVAEELGASVWPEPMRSHLLGIQYTARGQAHCAKNPGAASHVIRADGVNAGWAVVDTMPHEVRLMEIMVLPEMRGRGIGTAAIEEILSSAAGARKPVRLNVNVMNRRAIRLYERRGFRGTERNAVQYLMECGGERPGAAA